MTREEHEQLVQNILTNLSDQGAVSDALNTLREDYTETLTTVETLTTDKTTLEKHNESLRNVNNKMMLKLGDFSDVIDSKKPPVEEPKEEEMKFEDLFNDEGEMI